MQAILELVRETFHCFSWLNPLLDLGQKRMLEENDMYKLLPEDRAAVVGEELQRYFSHVFRLFRALLQYGGRNAAEVFGFEERLHCFDLVLLFSYGRALNLPISVSRRIKSSASFFAGFGTVKLKRPLKNCGSRACPGP